MSRRLAKQLIYGFFYLLILAGLIAGVYFEFLKSAPNCFDGKLNQDEAEIDCGGPNCADCALKRLKPLKVLPIQIFELGEKSVTALIEIRNPNLNYGASKFIYDLNFYDNSGNILETITDESFIYAGEIKNIVLAPLEVDFRLVGKSELIPRDFIWQKPEVFERPETNAREIITKVESAGIAVQGVVQNKNSYFIDKAVVSAVIFGNSGLPLGASKTFVADLKPFEDRFFRIFIPASPDDLKNLDTKLTRVYIESRR